MGIISRGDVKIDATTGGMDSFLDGVSGSLVANGWKKLDYVMPEAYHLQGVRMRWKDGFTGDYGFVNLINPINGNGYVNPTVAVSVSDTTITLESAAVAANFNPAYGALRVEFWSDDDSNLVECRCITSVSGSIVTLTEGASNAHTTSARLRCVVGSFSPCRGTHGISGGFRLLAGNGLENIRSEHNYTALISSGLIIGARFKTTSDAGTRELTLNYRFRKP